MSFTFTRVNTIEEINPPGPSAGKPTKAQVFKWWVLAVPAPEYFGCVVNISKGSANGTTADLEVFDPSSETTQSATVTVDLTDLGSVWSGPPSTIIDPATNAVNQGQYGLLFFTDKWLLKNAPGVRQTLKANPQFTVKYPFASDGIVNTINELKNALNEAVKTTNSALPSLPNFDAFKAGFPAGTFV